MQESSYLDKELMLMGDLFFNDIILWPSLWSCILEERSEKKKDTSVIIRHSQEVAPAKITFPLILPYFSSSIEPK